MISIENLTVEFGGFTLLDGKKWCRQIDTVETDSWSTTTYKRHHLLSERGYDRLSAATDEAQR
jgi:hypothetical protein